MYIYIYMEAERDGSIFQSGSYELRMEEFLFLDRYFRNFNDLQLI